MHDDPLEGAARADAATAEPQDEPATAHAEAYVHAPPDERAITRIEPSDESEPEDEPPPRARAWDDELPRWLATLDSPRTRREYEKAVTYFFRTPGVPQTLSDLTFDLLLAYRGSLALRAERRVAEQPRPSARAGGRHGALESGTHAERAMLTGDPSTADDDTLGSEDPTADHGERALSPLAPATVNIRLTALRQFLAHCSLWGELPHLAPERMRAALRRLRIERRRPYQILAEPEWNAFLGAARAPLRRAQPARPDTGDGSAARPPRDDDDRPAVAEGQAPQATRRLWGVPRAVRQRRASESSAVEARNGADATGDDGGSAVSPAATSPAEASPLPRSRAGLTGARTAQRDHALLSLALATGLRAIELCSLDLGDLSREWHAGQEEWWLVLPDAKTKGQRGGRTLPLALELVETLLAYARATGRQWESSIHRATPLFLSRQRVASHGSGGNRAERPAATSWRRLSPEQVRRIVDRVETQWIAETAGAGDGDGRAISPHALRHSTAVALLEGNERNGRPPASVEHVRGWLGHFDIRTTQGYLAHLDARRNRRPFALRTTPGDASARASDGPQSQPSARDDTKSQ